MPKKKTPLRHARSLRVRRVDWIAMQTHVKSRLPEEACGFVAGVRNRSTAVFPIENVLHRSDSFLMDAPSQLAAMVEIDENGWDLLAIYHSHPGGELKPSPQDVAGHYPESALLIWAPVVGGWSCFAYRLSPQGTAEETPIDLLLK